MNIRVVDAQLSVRIGAHGVHEARGGDEHCVTLAACEGRDRDVVTAEAWYWMHLLALAEPLAQAELATFVVAPGEDLGEFAVKSRLRSFLLFSVFLSDLLADSIVAACPPLVCLLGAEGRSAPYDRRPIRTIRLLHPETRCTSSLILMGYRLIHLSS